jgi:hypothetical protein
MQELAGGAVCRFLLVEFLSDSREKSVKSLGPYHRPGEDLKLPRMKACDEVSIWLIVNNLLEFKSGSGCSK